MLVVAIIVNYISVSYNLDISIKVAISNFKAQNYGCESDRELIECVFGKSGHRCGAKFHESDKGTNAAMKLCSVHYSKVILNIQSTVKPTASREKSCEANSADLNEDTSTEDEIEYSEDVEGVMEDVPSVKQIMLHTMSADLKEVTRLFRIDKNHEGPTSAPNLGDLLRDICGTTQR